MKLNLLALIFLSLLSQKAQSQVIPEYSLINYYCSDEETKLADVMNLYLDLLSTDEKFDKNYPQLSDLQKGFAIWSHFDYQLKYEGFISVQKYGSEKHQLMSFLRAVEFEALAINCVSEVFDLKQENKSIPRKLENCLNVFGLLNAGYQNKYIQKYLETHLLALVKFPGNETDLKHFSGTLTEQQDTLYVKDGLPVLKISNKLSRLVRYYKNGQLDRSVWYYPNGVKRMSSGIYKVFPKIDTTFYKTGNIFKVEFQDSSRFTTEKYSEEQVLIERSASVLIGKKNRVRKHDQENWDLEGNLVFSKQTGEKPVYKLTDGKLDIDTIISVYNYSPFFQLHPFLNLEMNKSLLFKLDTLFFEALKKRDKKHLDKNLPIFNQFVAEVKNSVSETEFLELQKVLNLFKFSFSGPSQKLIHLDSFRISQGIERLESTTLQLLKFKNKEQTIKKHLVYLLTNPDVVFYPEGRNGFVENGQYAFLIHRLEILKSFASVETEINLIPVYTSHLAAGLKIYGDRIESFQKMLLKYQHYFDNQFPQKVNILKQAIDGLLLDAPASLQSKIKMLKQDYTQSFPLAMEAYYKINFDQNGDFLAPIQEYQSMKEKEFHLFPNSFCISKTSNFSPASHRQLSYELVDFFGDELEVLTKKEKEIIDDIDHITSNEINYYNWIRYYSRHDQKLIRVLNFALLSDI